MDDCSWMYGISPKTLCKMDYCNRLMVLLIMQYLILIYFLEEVLDFHIRGVKKTRSSI